VTYVLRLGVVASVAMVLLGRWHPPVWGAWLIVAAVALLALESGAWNRVHDRSVVRDPEDSEDAAVLRARARYDAA